MLNMSNAIVKNIENLSHPISTPATNPKSISPFGSYNFPLGHQQKFLPQQLHHLNQHGTDENLTSTPECKVNFWILSENVIRMNLEKKVNFYMHKLKLLFG